MSIEVVKYPDGITFTRLIDNGSLIAEYCGRWTLRQMIQKHEMMQKIIKEGC